jgi:thiamine kinase-like enzyme
MCDRLTRYKIPFDGIIGDLSSGPRIIINDRKPYLPFYCMADGVSIERDSGIHSINLPQECPVIVQELNGASFAKVYLVQKEDGSRFVRKYIPKGEKAMDIHVEKLKRQLEDMKRFEFMYAGIVPRILGSHESSNEFYYDIEYLENHRTLSTFNDGTVSTIITRILGVMIENIYCFKRKIRDPCKWLNDFLSSKIYPKLELVPDEYKHLIYDTIKINGLNYGSVDNMIYAITKDYSSVLAPKYECPIHGDFTLENIMYDSENDDFKLIDNEGSRYYDAVEMDVGKLFQSVVCKYSSWKDGCDDMVDILSLNEYIIDDSYLLDESRMTDSIIRSFDGEWLLKGLFYMTTYFIRMMPFMINKSEKHFVFTILLCRIHLNNVISRCEQLGHPS